MGVWEFDRSSGGDGAVVAWRQAQTSLAVLSINPLQFNPLPYDPNNDLGPVAQLVNQPYPIGVHNSVPANMPGDMSRWPSNSPINTASAHRQARSTSRLKLLSKPAGGEDDPSRVKTALQTSRTRLRGLTYGKVRVCAGEIAARFQYENFQFISLLTLSKSPIMQLLSIVKICFPASFVAWETKHH